MRPTFLVLTEDTSTAAATALTALVTKMLRQIEPGLDEARLKFTPAEANERSAMGFNLWKAQTGEGHQKRVELTRTMVTRLMQEQFVLVHVDGDRPYRESHNGTKSENRESFEKLVLAPVRALLATRGQTELAANLLLLVPYHSVESWYYQNVDEALQICHEQQPRNQAAIDWFSHWRTHPEDLDEHEQAPKDLTWLGSKFNVRLAENSYPATKVFNLEKSFAMAVLQLLNNQALVNMLKAACYGQNH